VCGDLSFGDCVPKSGTQTPEKKTALVSKYEHHGGLDGQTWLTMPQIAAHLGTGREQIRRWIKSGKLRAVRIGKFTRVSVDELSDFLRRNQTGGEK
jgi:excisionase family DNA binding protein